MYISPILLILLISLIYSLEKKESYCPEYDTDCMDAFFSESAKAEETPEGFGLKGWSIIGFIYIVLVVSYHFF